MTSTPLYLESGSPDLVSIDTRDAVNICQDHGDSRQMKHYLTKHKTSSICLSETNLGTDNFKSSVEIANIPSTLITGNFGSWKTNHHTSSETLGERGQNQIMTPTILHQQERYPIGIQSQNNKQSHSTDLMSHNLQPEHDEFIQNEAAQDVSPSKIKPSQRMSQNFSTNSNSSPHMYL